MKTLFLLNAVLAGVVIPSYFFSGLLYLAALAFIACKIKRIVN